MKIVFRNFEVEVNGFTFFAWELNGLFGVDGESVEFTNVENLEGWCKAEAIFLKTRPKGISPQPW